MDKIIVWIWMLGQHKYLPVENNYRKPRITTRPRKRINLILNTGSFKYIKFGSGSRILPNFYPGPGLCFQFRTFKKKYLLRKKNLLKNILLILLGNNWHRKKFFYSVGSMKGEFLSSVLHLVLVLASNLSFFI